MSMTNQNSKTVVIVGEAKSEAQRYKAEYLLRLKAPDSFVIINNISIARYF